MDSNEGLRLISLLLCILVFIVLINQPQSLSLFFFLTLPVNPSGSQELLKTRPSLHFSRLPASGIPPLILILTFKELTPPRALNSTADTSPPNSSRLSPHLHPLQSVTYLETGSCQISQATVSRHMKSTDSWLKLNTAVSQHTFHNPQHPDFLPQHDSTPG